MADGKQAVGYCRPPVHTRFKPGQSGNPTGKRKPRPSLSQRLDRILAEIVPVTEGGKSRRMDKEEVFLRQTVTRAIAGDRQMAKLMLDYLAKRQASTPAASSSSSTDEFLMSELVSFLGQDDSQ